MSKKHEFIDTSKYVANMKSTTPFFKGIPNRNVKMLGGDCITGETFYFDENMNKHILVEGNRTLEEYLETVKDRMNESQIKKIRK